MKGGDQSSDTTKILNLIIIKLKGGDYMQIMITKTTNITAKSSGKSYIRVDYLLPDGSADSKLISPDVVKGTIKPTVPFKANANVDFDSKGWAIGMSSL